MKPAKVGKGVSKIGNYPDKRLVWDDTRAFLAVTRAGTLSAAAEQMGIGIATLSRRIERLEEALGVPLFVRQQSGYQLTQDGGDLIPQAEAMEEAAASLRRGARERTQIAGTVRLATAENLASALILPEMGNLFTAYPALTIQIVTDIATVNLHRRDADLALRLVKPERGNVTLQRVGTMGYGLYASSEYVAKRRSGFDIGNYEADIFIGWCETQGHLPAAQWVERVLKGRAPSIMTTSLSTQIAAAKSGLGLAVLPHFLAADADLVCVEGDLGIDQALYLVIQSDLAQSPRIRIVADFLRDLVHTHQKRLLGL